MNVHSQKLEGCQPPRNTLPSRGQDRSRSAQSTPARAVRGIHDAWNGSRAWSVCSPAGAGARAGARAGRAQPRRQDRPDGDRQRAGRHLRPARPRGRAPHRPAPARPSRGGAAEHARRRRAGGGQLHLQCCAEGRHRDRDLQQGHRRRRDRRRAGSALRRHAGSPGSARRSPRPASASPTIRRACRCGRSPISTRRTCMSARSAPARRRPPIPRRWPGCSD